jgi:hypothetical protein
VERFYEGDPTKTKKYFEYFLKTWTNRHQQITFTSPKLIEMVRGFDELLPYIDNKDIYHKDYQKVEDLINVLVDAEIKRAGKEFVKSEHVQILNETENYIMLRPLTHVGSLKYGATPVGAHHQGITPKRSRTTLVEDFWCIVYPRRKPTLKGTKNLLFLPKIVVTHSVGKYSCITNKTPRFKTMLFKKRVGTILTCMKSYVDFGWTRQNILF